MFGPAAEGSSRRLDVLSPITAVVFSAVCWLVFSRLFGHREAASLLELSRQFLLVQPWWLGAGLLGLGITALTRTSEPDSSWNRASQVYSLALAAFSVVNIGWGIVAMYQLVLTPVDI